MIIYDMEQGTPEWHLVRSGKLTGSHGTAIATAGKGLNTYVAKIVEDLLFPKDPNDQFISKDMERGNELEPAARIKYEFEKGVIIREVGFIQGDGAYGVSPDGLVEDDGGVEIKARNNAKHLALLRGKTEVESGTRWQIQMCMLVAQRKWWDFISYNPNFRKHSMFVKRFYPVPEKVDKLKKGIDIGCEMLESSLKEGIIKEELSLLNFLNKS